MTAIAVEMLERYWEAATDDVPLIIVGAGRWGRLWSDVAAQARSTAKNIALIARSNLDETLHWQTSGFDGRRRMIVANTFGAAWTKLATQGPTTGAVVIVASRPRDHISDARQALALGIPVLIEKPISADAVEALRFLTDRVGTHPVIGLGVEFSMLPTAHFLSQHLTQRRVAFSKLALIWDDPAGEVRHGDAKRQHAEVSVLDDLLPHAISLARIFARGDDWSISHARLADDGMSGAVVIRCGEMEMVFNCNRAALRRARVLSLSGELKSVATLDFTEAPRIVLGSEILAIPARVENLRSTLRLELGAFLSDVQSIGAPSPISDNLALYARLQSELPKSHLSAKR